MKTCTSCKESKELTEFYIDNRSKKGYRTQCKKCMNLFSRQNENKYKNTRYKYKIENQDHIKAYHRSLYIKDKERILERNAKYRNTVEYKFSSYRASAIRRNILFDISIETFKNLVENKNCFYCNDFYESQGVDRKESSIGYTIDNCVSCCSMCNRIKNIYSESTFLKKIKQIYEFKNS